MDAFSDAFDRDIPDATVDAKETPGAGKDSGILTLKRYHQTVVPTVQPVLVEQQIQYKVNGVPFSGYIDLVDSRRRVRDLKTVKQKPSRSDYALNMIGYALGFRQLTGETETGVQLDYMVRTQQPYHHPITSEGPIPDTAISAFADVVSGVADAVSKGVFLPTGINNNACSWCGYTQICDAYKRTRSGA